jgi:putative transposase
LREAHRKADEKGIPHENEKAVFALLTEQRELEKDAAEKTKSARRAQQKRAACQCQSSEKEDLPTASQATPAHRHPQ